MTATPTWPTVDAVYAPAKAKLKDARKIWIAETAAWAAVPTASTTQRYLSPATMLASTEPFLEVLPIPEQVWPGTKNAPSRCSPRVPGPTDLSPKRPACWPALWRFS